MGNSTGAPSVGRVVVTDAHSHDAHMQTHESKQQLRSDIARTRAEMAETIDQIQHRLDPAVLKERAKEKVEEKVEQAKDRVKSEVHDHIVEAKQAVRRKTIGRVEHMVHRAGHDIDDARSNIVETIRENPVPAAMVGAGLAWLLMGSKKTRSRHTRDLRSERYYAPLPVYEDAAIYGDSGYVGEYDLVEGDEVGSFRGDRSDSRGMTARARGAAHDVKSRAGDVAHDVRDRAEHVAHDVRDRAEHMAHDVRDRAEHMLERGQATASDLASRARVEGRRASMRARRTARSVEGTVERAFRDNPLAIGAAAIAIGTMVGLALPSTEKEDRLLGTARDKLVDKAERAAEGALDKVTEKTQERFSDIGQA